MSTTFQTLIPRHSILTHTPLYLTPTHLHTIHLRYNSHSPILNIKPLSIHPHNVNRHPFIIKSLDSDRAADTFNLDDFLSIAEILSLASSAALSIGFVINSTFSGLRKPVFLEWVGNSGGVWQSVLLVVGVVIGVVIRRRQWRRVCLGFSRPGGSGVVNLVERIEKVEEDVRASGSVIRVLSRQLEKLGIRFRVTRKSMKEPIAQTAELAKRNSEVTRALAMQEDNLERELAEIQKVLLAMQDQQQKQLELILVIAKSGKLLDNKPLPSQDAKKSQTSNLAAGVSNSDGNR